MPNQYTPTRSPALLVVLAAVMGLLYHQETSAIAPSLADAAPQAALRSGLLKAYLALLVISGIVAWWLVLAHKSRQVAQEESNRQTGLLVRADMVGPRGEVLDSSAFTDLKLGIRTGADSVVLPMKRLDGYRVLHPQSQRVQLEAEGWSQSKPVAGFQLLSSTRRALEAIAGSGDARQVLQVVYSDGMTHVSVFIEPYDVQRHKPMRTSLGATQTSMSRQGDWWITVMGDVPMTTVQQFETVLQRK